jgi:putative phosphoesterase
MKIGLLSDTHGWIHPKLYEFFSGVDEIWHAGDIGNTETADKLLSFKPLRAVYGNIDGAEVRLMFTKSLRFTVEGKKIFITHIGGYPGHYEKDVRKELFSDPPDIFICGHSHIARVMFDHKGDFLHINPGAAGYTGFHKIMTAVRFQIDNGNIHDLELIELGERGNVKI